MKEKWDKDPLYSVLLADGMGRQKTRSSLAAAHVRSSMNGNIKCLVLCLLGQENFWKSEASLTCPLLRPNKAIFYQGPKRHKLDFTQTNLVLTNAATLASDYQTCLGTIAHHDPVDRDLFNTLTARSTTTRDDKISNSKKRKQGENETRPSKKIKIVSQETNQDTSHKRKEKKTDTSRDGIQESQEKKTDTSRDGIQESQEKKTDTSRDGMQKSKEKKTDIDTIQKSKEQCIVLDAEHGPLLAASQRAQSPLYDTKWDILIIDEPTHLSHPFWTRQSNIQAQACYNLDYGCVIILNGTLIRNKLTDLAGQLYMLRRKPTCESSWWKKNKSNPQAIRFQLGKCAYMSKDQGTVSVNVENESILLPMSTIQDQMTEMCRDEAKEMYHAWTKTHSDSYDHLWTKITDMLLCCDSPELVKDGPKRSWSLQDSPKMEYLVHDLLPRLLSEHTPHQQVIIFSRYKTVFSLLATYLHQVHPKHFGQAPLMLVGDQDPKERSQVLKSFQERSSSVAEIKHKPWWKRVMCTTYQTGSLGYNLEQGCHVIFYNRAWNPATEDQAWRRVVRPKQIRDVTIYSLTCDDPRSAEQWMDTLQTQKRHLISKIELQKNQQSHTSVEVDETRPSLSTRDMFHFLFTASEPDAETWSTFHGTEEEQEKRIQEYYCSHPLYDQVTTPVPVTRIQDWFFSTTF